MALPTLWAGSPIRPRGLTASDLAAGARLRCVGDVWNVRRHGGRTRVGRDGLQNLVVSVALSRKDPSPRRKQVVEPSRGRFMHHMELYGIAAVDEELVDWIAEAWQAAA